MGACSNNDIKISVVVFDSCMKRLCDAVGGVPTAENQPERNKIGLGIGGDQSEARQPFIPNNAPRRRTLTLQYGDAAFILASQDYWKEQTIFLRIVEEQSATYLYIVSS